MSETVALGQMVSALAILRQLAVLHPDGKFPKALPAALALRHPPNVWLVAVAFPHLCRSYLERHERLCGPRGALLLLHAAYAELMTGLVAADPTVQDLLADRDTSDPAIERAWQHYVAVTQDLPTARALQAAPLSELPSQPAAAPPSTAVPSRTAASTPVSVVLLHAPKDQPLAADLHSHLAAPMQQGLLDVWHLGLLAPGADGAAELAQRLAVAELVVPLLSANLLSWPDGDKHIAASFKRRTQGHAEVVPVLLRKVHLGDHPLSKLKALPTTGRPVASAPRREEALAAVAAGLLAAAQRRRPSA